MLGLRWPELRCVLAVGAHSDDIEIGCGATLLRLLREHPRARVVWVVLAAVGAREAEAWASAEAFLAGAGARDVRIGGFRDGRFPAQWDAIKTFFGTLTEVEPDLVLTHHGQDLHQDHRIASEMAWSTFRDRLILEYEVPKWDGGMGSPNLFVPASTGDADAKIATLLGCFPSQSGKHWFDDGTFRGLMRLRGLECNAPEGLAEAFYARKLRVGWPHA